MMMMMMTSLTDDVFLVEVDVENMQTSFPGLDVDLVHTILQLLQSAREERSLEVEGRSRKRKKKRGKKRKKKRKKKEKKQTLDSMTLFLFFFGIFSSIIIKTTTTKKIKCFRSYHE